MATWIDDINSELAEATREADQGQASLGSEPATAPAPKVEDFDDPSVMNDTHDLDDDDAEDEPAAPSKSVLKKSATRIVKAFSSVVKLLAKKVYPAKILEPGDGELHAQIRAQVDAAPKSQKTDVFNSLIAQPEAAEMYERFLACQSAIEAAPLDQEEIEAIAEPLSDCLEKWKAAPGPETALIIAVLVVMLPRIEPLFPGLSKAFGAK